VVTVLLWSHNAGIVAVDVSMLLLFADLHAVAVCEVVAIYVCLSILSNEAVQ